MSTLVYQYCAVPLSALHRTLTDGGKCAGCGKEREQLWHYTLPCDVYGQPAPWGEGVSSAGVAPAGYCGRPCFLTDVARNLPRLQQQT